MLLDAAGNAKVADFGTVREGAKKGKHGTVNTHALTGLIVGTKGYMPPEYEKSGHVSEKTDSYAFSILLLELLTGRVGLEAAAVYHEEPDLFEEMMDYVDARAGAWPPPVVAELVAVAQRCICMHARPRASVREVMPQLEAIAVPAAPRLASLLTSSTSSSSSVQLNRPSMASASASGTDID